MIIVLKKQTLENQKCSSNKCKNEIKNIREEILLFNGFQVFVPMISISVSVSISISVSVTIGGGCEQCGIGGGREKRENGAAEEKQKGERKKRKEEGEKIRLRNKSQKKGGRKEYVRVCS